MFETMAIYKYRENKLAFSKILPKMTKPLSQIEDTLKNDINIDWKYPLTINET